MSLSRERLAEVTAWRQDFHRYPELGYQEHRTSQRIAARLRSWGLQVTEGLAGTGVVATLENGPGPAIGLRADMDALPIQELGEAPWRSQHPGVMHACGHDGHTAILLAAARELSEQRAFSGTVHFLFQPAEENLGGARRLVEEGLFRRFPMDAIYALHNWPGLPLGEVALNAGAMMASLDPFEITLTGQSCHAAMPENGADPIVAAAQLIMALQTIPSRRLAPTASAVVSVTQINGGEAINVIPETVVLKGTLRCLQQPVRNRVRALIGQFVEAQSALSGVEGALRWHPGYPVTDNHAAAAAQVKATAQQADWPLRWDVTPSMASEDFACLLEQCPGAYFWIGADGHTPSAPLHNARYDFNDALLAPAVTFLLRLVRQCCPPTAAQG
ncbi:M20 aminoacylase family protein [Pantoea sp. 1.19]|uniref:M20 aminoacylase family protein n=1 Tax=Pantoea sp. 1.19 TaxID=1925589 RepID=UPI000948A4A8|nr:M20 aminoacylase family protein [Pantoea sp. 1.19]